MHTEMKYKNLAMPHNGLRTCALTPKHGSTLQFLAVHDKS